jgi:hypothetical protein
MEEILQPGAEQQFVPEDFEFTVENRLASDEQFQDSPSALPRSEQQSGSAAFRREIF